VILEGLLVFISGGGPLESLRCAGMCLDFRHFSILRYCCEPGSHRLAIDLVNEGLTG
jgi:hypothetical protein